MGDWNGEERRGQHRITEAQFAALVDNAADKVFERVYAEIGKNVVRKALWFVGAGLAALAAWLAGSGRFPGP